MNACLSTILLSELNNITSTNETDMQTIVVGAGRMAREILDGFRGPYAIEVAEWATASESAGPSIVIHAGSGRELEDVVAFCERTNSTLVEVATGSAIENRAVPFPVVLCPNTNILMLKFMVMVARSSGLFKGCRIGLTESHQAAKTSTPGTAVGVAHSLGLPSDQIRSVRDPVEQAQVLGHPRRASRTACVSSHRDPGRPDQPQLGNTGVRQGSLRRRPGEDCIRHPFARTGTPALQRHRVRGKRVVVG